MVEPPDILKPNRKSIKAIRIGTVVPFSYPFSQKILKIKMDTIYVTAIFETKKREDIAELLFPHIVPDVNYRTDSIGVTGFGQLYDNWSWMSPDRFGQLNFMTVVFYLKLEKEEIIDINSDEIKKEYLSKCADLINLISTAYRITTKD